MNVYEIIAGGLLIISCVLIILAVTVQTPKGSGLSGAIMGGDASVGAQGGRGKSNDARLAGLTKILAIVFFAVAFLANILVLAIK